jgi:hypothetical protein
MNNLLESYHCSFYLPLDFGDLSPEPHEIHGERWQVSVPKEGDRLLSQKSETTVAERDVQGNKQAYLYISPLLHDKIFDIQGGKKSEKKRGLLHWQLPVPQDSELIVKDGDTDLTANISHVLLHRYYNGLYLLEIRVFMPKDLTAMEKEYQCWLRFTKLARIVYPSFLQQEEENKIRPVKLKWGSHVEKHFKIQDQFSGIIAYLIERFFGEKHLKTQIETCRENLRDDRMFVNVAYGWPNHTTDMQDQASKDEYDRRFSLALYVDDESDTCTDLDSYPYDPTYIKNLMKDQTLDRWRGLGTLMGFTDYSNVYMGQGSYFNEAIAPEHVMYQYARMLMLALFYRETLHNFDQEITDATEDLISKQNKGYREKFRKLREDFICFTNNHWFHQITSQIQGIEIFTRQTEQLGLEKHYAQIKDEMERADEFLETDRNIRFDEKTDKFSRIAAVFGIFALLMVLPTVKWGIAMGWAFGILVIGVIAAVCSVTTCKNATKKLFSVIKDQVSRIKSSY